MIRRVVHAGTLDFHLIIIEVDGIVVVIVIVIVIVIVEDIVAKTEIFVVYAGIVVGDVVVLFY